MSRAIRGVCTSQCGDAVETLTSSCVPLAGVVSRLMKAWMREAGRRHAVVNAWLGDGRAKGSEGAQEVTQRPWVDEG